MHCTARYHPSRDQLELAGELISSLERLLPLSRLHLSPDETEETWHALNDIGLFGITLGEALGGSGLGATEEALIAMGLGRCAVAPAVIATMGALHASEFPVLPFDVRRGRVAAGYRRGERILKIQEPHSSFTLLREDHGAVLVESGSTSRRLDTALWLADLHVVPNVGRTIASFNDERLLQLRLLDAAVLVGVAEAAVAMAVAYAGLRQQFGRPIGSFQAVKHHCANMAMAARRARDQTSFAATAMDERRKDAPLQVECAFLTAGNAALESAGLNIQVHGGIGFSEEADPHLLLKRAQLYIHIAGGLEAASGRIAAIEPFP